MGKANLTASKARMAAAKDSLMKKFNLDASELESHIKAACASRRRLAVRDMKIRLAIKAAGIPYEKKVTARLLDDFMQDPTNGNIKANLTASKARMAAAKDSLMEKFNLDASELESHIKAACAFRRRLAVRDMKI